MGALDRQRRGIWTTRAGRAIHVSEMSDAHLVNTLLMLCRKAERRAGSEMGDAWAAATDRTLQGEVNRAIQSELLDMLIDDDGDVRDGMVDEYLHAMPIVPHIICEIRRRGLDDKLLR